MSMARRRTEKYRGGRTHGRGKKGGRGAGLRGGKGNAGLHKHKYIHTVKYDPYHFGRHGFKRHSSLHEDKVAINVGQVQTELPRFLEHGIAKKDEKGLVLDLTQTKVVKLLGGGIIKIPLTIRVLEATETAIGKVEAAGGKVLVPEDSDE
jgi:large subunit ribosomal protein L15